MSLTSEKEFGKFCVHDVSNTKSKSKERCHFNKDSVEMTCLDKHTN